MAAVSTPSLDPLPPGRGAGPPGGALVIGGDCKALGIVRSLGRRAVPVWVLTDEHRLAATSRYTCRSLPWPGGAGAPAAQFLVDLARREGLAGWALFPTRDDVVALLAPYHASLSAWYRLTIPPPPIVTLALDKRQTYRLAARLGIAHPWTRYPRGRDEVLALDCPFPAILKPATKDRDNRFTQAKAWRVEDRAALVARYDEACALLPADEVMIQELIPGGGEDQYSYAALCQEGRALASVVARRVRQYPMDFGRASTYVETVDRPEIEAPAQRLLRAMGYTGLVEVEFKRDRRDGSYRLFDVNPRVWGWHTLGARAGVDFSYLCWRLLSGEPVARVRGRSGARWMRLTTDLPTAAKEILHGRLSLRAYLRSLRRPVEGAVFAADDPAPGLAEAPLTLQLLWKRRQGAPGWRMP